MRRVEDRLAGWRMRLADADPEVDLTVCERLGGRLICPGDPEWPSQLDALGPKAPYGLWLRGPVDLRYRCLRSVAVVGARAATDYGCRTASDLAAELVDRGWSVVSGGALGIDAAAHRGSLAADGPTMAVLANGVDVAYPPRNEALLAEIGQRGLLISEWPPGFHPTRGRFLIRNRVIAALTLGTVVVEADLRSGSLNTARYAEELNRPVLAVPGPVTSLMSRGCHAWIRDGRATCVSSALEIIESLGRMGEDLAPVRRGPVLPRDRLDPEACRILDAFPATGNVGIAQIAVRAGVDITTTQNRLSLLAAAGFIERRGQNWRLPRSTPNPRSDNGLVG
jgi:DNA processing protein